MPDYIVWSLEHEQDGWHPEPAESWEEAAKIFLKHHAKNTPVVVTEFVPITISDGHVHQFVVDNPLVERARAK